MNLSKNDPKITAYALGEIDDPKEREAIAAAVAASAEPRSPISSNASRPASVVKSASHVSAASTRSIDAAGGHASTRSSSPPGAE